MTDLPLTWTPPWAAPLCAVLTWLLLCAVVVAWSLRRQRDAWRRLHLDAVRERDDLRTETAKLRSRDKALSAQHAVVFGLGAVIGARHRAGLVPPLGSPRTGPGEAALAASGAEPPAPAACAPDEGPWPA